MDVVKEEACTERRRAERRSLEATIGYAVNIPNVTNPVMLAFLGEIVDVSASGIGIKTNNQLMPGQTISFSRGLGRGAGVVQWCTLNNELSDNLFRAGIRFI